jgi:hypothetical protein
MKNLFALFSLFILCACQPTSMREKMAQSSLSIKTPKETLLQNKWRDIYAEDTQCLSENCVKYFIVVSFTKDALIRTGIDRVTRQVVKQKITPISQLDHESFVVSSDQTSYTYEISNDRLTICEQGSTCFEMPLYTP